MHLMRRERIARLALTLIIFLGGLALIPFVDLPTEAIGWELLAGVYAPELAVNATEGAPGSVFAFTGSGYPAQQEATIYVDGDPIGVVQTTVGGTASFALNTAGSLPGLYNVTLEVDINASATQSISLVVGGSYVTPPDGFDGVVINLGHPIYYPLNFK